MQGSQGDEASADPRTRDELAWRLLEHLGSQENVIARVAKSHPVLSALGLQRQLIRLLASGPRRLQLVAGLEGSGKSSLLAVLEAQARARFPLLSIHSCPRLGAEPGRARAVRLLRELWRQHGDAEELATLSPNEILHNGPSFFRRVGEQTAGLILLLDDLDLMHGGDVPSWLPCPLPPGLHCVATCGLRQPDAAAAAPAAVGLAAAEVAVHRLPDLGPCDWGRVTPRQEDAEIPAAAEPLCRSRLALAEPRLRSLLLHLVALRRETWEQDLRAAAVEKVGSQVEGLELVDLVAAGGSDVVALAVLRACEAPYMDLVAWVAALLRAARHGLACDELAHLVDRAIELHRERCASLLAEGVALEAAISELVDSLGPLLRSTSSQCSCGAAADARASTLSTAPSAQQERHHFVAAGDFFARAVDILCEPELRGRARLLLASHFLPSATARCAARVIDEVAEQLWQADTASPEWHGKLLEFSSRPRVLEHYADRPEELAAIWRRWEGGAAAVASRIALESSSASWPAVERLAAGRLLSAAGQFAEARTLLQDAAALLKGRHELLSLRAEALVLVANNEVRYWDSRRDWGSVEPLKLLLESSAQAVEAARHGVAETCWPASRLLARALSRRANGCFKAGCVCAPGGSGQLRYFDEADECVAEAVRLCDGRRVQILGEAILVGGVTTLCRAHAFQKARRPNETLDHAVAAAVHFYRAEAVLREAVGPVNEKSIYTHSNLAELLLGVLRMPLTGFLHLRQSCVVAVRVFGTSHANASSKLREFGDLFEQLQRPDWAQAARDGHPEQVEPAQLTEFLLSMPLRSSAAATRLTDALGSADDANIRRYNSPFWESLFQDLGLREDLAFR